MRHFLIQSSLNLVPPAISLNNFSQPSTLDRYSAIQDEWAVATLHYNHSLPFWLWELRSNLLYMKHWCYTCKSRGTRSELLTLERISCEEQQRSRFPRRCPATVPWQIFDRLLALINLECCGSRIAFLQRASSNHLSVLCLSSRSATEASRLEVSSCLIRERKPRWVTASSGANLGRQDIALMNCKTM